MLMPRGSPRNPTPNRSQNPRPDQLKTLSPDRISGIFWIQAQINVRKTIRTHNPERCITPGGLMPQADLTTGLLLGT